MWYRTRRRIERDAGSAGLEIERMSGSSMSLTGGEWVVRALGAEGVRHVFGIPGVHNLAIYDALLKQSEITHVLARHEQGAAFMADGYARASGRPGVVLVTTGPGATNTLTPLVESYAGSQPVLALMSDIAAPLIGRDLGALHEVPNQIECFRPVCRRAETILEAHEIPGAIGRAFDLFETSRPGPVALSLPNDLLAMRTEARLSHGARRRPDCDARLIDEAARVLSGARRPLIIAGGGAIAAGAAVDLQALARRLGAPVLTTVMGRGIMAETDPLWLGVLPNKRASQEAIEAADVILAVGCRFAHRSTQGLLLNLAFRPEQKLIHLDLDPAVIGKMHRPAVGIVGDARAGLRGLLEALGRSAPATAWDREWLARKRAARAPRYTETVDRLIRMLRETLAVDAIVVNDQTGLNYWMEWHFPVLGPRTFLYPVGSATLGYAVPAAIGAKVAHPGRQVIAVAGDGGFLFSVNELATAVKYGLGIVFLVLNDQRYGAIKYLQEGLFGRWGEADLANPDFPALARAFGAEGERVERLDDLPRALEKALGHPGPTLLEVPVAIDPPWEL
jgi:acetolactate synthase-1/2/3 large subunit